MIFWTHLYDLVAKVMALIIAVGISLMVILPLHLPKQTTGILFAFGAVTLAVLIYVFILRTIGSILYCRFSLKAKFTFPEAKQLNPVLSPFASLVWCPLKEVRNTPSERQFTEAIRMATAWTDARKAFVVQRTERLASQSLQFRVTRGILLTLMCVGFLAGFLAIPPTDKLAAFQASFGDDHKYSPLLNGLIVALIPGIFVGIMNRKVGIHAHHVSERK